MTIVSDDIQKAAGILKKGGIVAYPTESSYALGCQIGKEAVKKIYEIKQRPKNKGMTYIVPSLEVAGKYAVLSNNEKRIVKKLMPGRLTLVARNKRGGEFVFRIPSHPVALKLAKAFGKPITATSANISGKEAIYNPKKIFDLWNGKIDMILDFGILPKKRPSTIACVFDKIKICRRGHVTKKQIEDAL